MKKFKLEKFSLYLLVQGLGVNMLGCVFVLFLSAIKGFTSKEVSLIIGMTPLISLPVFFIWGGILDKYKKVILFSKLINLSNIITMALLILIKDFYLFFIVNVIRSILLQPAGSLNDKYLLNLSKGNKVIYGRTRVFSTIGFGLSGILAPLVISVGGVYTTLFVGIILILFCVIILSMIVDIKQIENVERNNEINKVRKQMLASTLALFKNKTFLKYLIVISTMYSTQNAATTYGIQIILIQLNAPNEYIGIIPFIMVIFEVLILLIYDKIKILRETDTAIIIALTILSIRWTAMAVTNSYITVLIATMLHGIVMGSILQIQNKLFAEIVPNDYQFSAFMLLGALSGIVLPSILNLLTGSLYEKFGIRVFGELYLALTCTALLIMIIDKYKIMNNKTLPQS